MKKILVASPIKKSAKILELFFTGLEILNKKEFEVEYCFIDDNDDKVSSKLTKEFIARNGGVVLEVKYSKGNSEGENKEHFWTSDKIERVAYFKNEIIKYFLKGDWDYIFFIDSDLILQQDTLVNLIGDEKDIVSNIFWTKWVENGREMPQVWLKDFYTLYDAHMLRAMTELQKVVEEEAFLKRLKMPGIYKVGGLGACTLIKRKVLESGVHFGSIYNISFWGEDRSFCIRAAALGFDLYVDTRSPAFHVFREEQVENGLDFLKGLIL